MIVDQITLSNKNEFFAYTGPEEGEFIRQSGNVIEVGAYKGAFPFITDGLFITKYKVICKDSNEARTRALEAAGKEALLSMLFALPNAYRTVLGNLIERVA